LDAEITEIAEVTEGGSARAADVRGARSITIVMELLFLRKVSDFLLYLDRCNRALSILSVLGELGVKSS
jgi:hypothetical protein